MRLVVKKSGSTVNEFRFGKGPVYIGRHAHSQVFLPDRAVSRQHAAIFSTQDGKWIVEDLDSANKTYLNDKAVHKAELKTGDHLRVADYTIEVNLEADADEPIQLEDTLITQPKKPAPASAQSTGEIVVRKPDLEQAPDIKLPAKRAKDFLQATETICKANGPDEVVKALLNVTLQDFGAHHVWCALRNRPEGPMTFHAGKSQDGRPVELSEIKLSEKITEAIEKKEFVLVPRVAALTKDPKISSAMIAPVVDPTGCFGVLYVDNARGSEHYSLSDLDYLMLLAIHTAAIVENF
jgi:pSer/pThr/pTyr-binding forkhead associated (FHA) protein